MNKYQKVKKSNMKSVKRC